VVSVVEVLVVIQYGVLVVRSGYTRNVACPSDEVIYTVCSTSVDIGVNATMELVDKFCYLGDMLRVDGDADAAVEDRIRIGWNKFRQLVTLFTSRDISLIEGDCTAVVCEVVCCMEVRQGLYGKKIKWHFTRQR